MAIYRYSYEFPAYQSLSKCVFLIFQPSHLIKNVATFLRDVATFFSSTFLVIFRHVEKCQHFWTDSSPVAAVAARRPAAGSGGGDAGLLRRVVGATEARGGRMGTREGEGRRERG
jgi:hypothetical protein